MKRSSFRTVPATFLQAGGGLMAASALHFGYSKSALAQAIGKALPQFTALRPAQRGADRRLLGRV